VIRFSVGRNRVTVWLDVRDAAPEGSTVKLTFLYQSVDDLDAALAFYRDVLGLAEAWREGDTTVAFELPGSPVQLMVDVRPDDHPKWGSGDGDGDGDPTFEVAPNRDCAREADSLERPQRRRDPLGCLSPTTRATVDEWDVRTRRAS
jgi:hypothetical protein